MKLTFIRQETVDFNFSTDKRVGRTVSIGKAYKKIALVKNFQSKSKVVMQSTSKLDESVGTFP